MQKVRLLAVAATVGMLSAIAGPAMPAHACEEPGATCVKEREICRDEVPKAVRVWAGCFDGTQN